MLDKIFWLAIGFFAAIGLMLILMPYMFPILKKTYEGNQVDSAKSSLKFGILMVPLLLVAGALYFKLGSPSVVSVSNDSRPMAAVNNANMPPATQNHEMGDLNMMAEKLAKKLEKDPSNAEGWALLARSYVELKQHENALPAFEKAIALLPQDAQLLADYVDARAITQHHQLDEKSAELIDKALKIDPNHPKALLLSGTLAFDHADYKKAIEIWEKLQAQTKVMEDTALQNQIIVNISEAKHLLQTSAKK